MASDEEREKLVEEVEEELEEEIQELEGQIPEEKKTKEMLHETEKKPEPVIEEEPEQRLVTKTAKPILQTPNVAERMPKSNSIFDILLPILAVLLIVAISFFLYGLFS